MWKLKSILPRARWSGTNKNRDVSTGPLARPFARSLAPLTRSLAPDCSLRSRPPLRSLVRSLAHFTHSLARGTVIDWMAILSVFFPVFDHSAILDRVFLSSFIEIVCIFFLSGYSYMKPGQLQLGISSEDKDRILRTFTRNVYDFHRSKILQVIQHHYSNYESPNDPQFIR